ncbi:hypothetical protein [Prevotella sp. AM34-19LB]|uniref:hypothetical protein n=1 Tax=Prevotella sp. AM34-19LB TaxID=2292364 RepID=UPI000E5C6298|nr:hypothetical protein [Prevotella sp. AM34-19LB]
MFWKKIIILYLALPMLCCLPSKAQKPGDIVSEQTIRKLGEKHFFSISPIPDPIFHLMQGKTYTSNPQPIGFSGILLAKRQNSFYCTYFLHNRNVADTKSPYPIKRLEVIRWFNQKSMVFNQSLS